MELAPASPPNPRPDPEFAADPSPAAAFPPGFDPVGHQRLVVNPFLAVAGLIGWAWATRQLFASALPPLAVLPAPLLAGLPLAVRVHCVDCGRTEAFPRWRRHACPRVVGRARAGRRRWGRVWPSARFQLILWGYGLGSAGLLAVVVVALA